MLEFCVDKQKIKRTDNDVIVANSVEFLEAEFNFSNEWSKMEKTAIFTNTIGSTSMLLNNKNRIESEAGLNLIAGSYVVSVVGIFGRKKIVTNIVNITISQSGAENGTVPLDPTPSIYDQIMVRLAEIELKLSKM